MVKIADYEAVEPDVCLPLYPSLSSDLNLDLQSAQNDEPKAHGSGIRSVIFGGPGNREHRRESGHNTAPIIYPRRAQLGIRRCVMAASPGRPSSEVFNRGLELECECSYVF